MSAFEVFRQFDEAGFNIISSQQTEDRENILIIADIKRPHSN